MKSIKTLLLHLVDFFIGTSEIKLIAKDSSNAIKKAYQKNIKHALINNKR